MSLPKEIRYRVYQLLVPTWAVDTSFVSFRPRKSIRPARRTAIRLVPEPRLTSFQTEVDYFKGFEYRNLRRLVDALD